LPKKSKLVISIPQSGIRFARDVEDPACPGLPWGAPWAEKPCAFFPGRRWRFRPKASHEEFLGKLPRSHSLRLRRTQKNVLGGSTPLLLSVAAKGEKPGPKADLDQ
jgi:hypothetical protein